MINIMNVRPLHVKADAYCGPHGHAGWGVIIYDQRIRCYSGHIFTSNLIVAKKIAFAIAMSASPAGEVVHLFTSCTRALDAYENIKPQDYFDEEILRLKAVKKLLLPVQCAALRVQDANKLARLAAVWRATSTSQHT